MKVICLCLLFGCRLLPAQTVEWVGLAGDGELYNPANWDTRARKGSVQAPPSTWVDANGLFLHDLFVYEAGLSSGKPILLDGRKLHLGPGGTLTLVDNGIGHTEMKVSRILVEDGHLSVRFLARIAVELRGESTLTLEGPNNCLNESSIEVVPSSTATVTFTDKDVARVRKEDMGKFTRNKKPIQDKVDVVVEAKGNGTILRFQAR